jgi:hypothetical protein
VRHRPPGAEHEGDAPDLAAEIAGIVGSGRVQASYGADERLRDHHGAARLVSIGLINSDLPDRESTEVERVLGTIAGAAAEWLRRREILTPGTLVSIELAREVDLWLVSWSRGRGAAATGSGPTAVRPRPSPTRRATSRSLRASRIH